MLKQTHTHKNVLAGSIPATTALLGFADARHETPSTRTAAVRENNAVRALGSAASTAWVERCSAANSRPLASLRLRYQGTAQHSHLTPFLTYRHDWVRESLVQEMECGHDTP